MVRRGALVWAWTLFGHWPNQAWLPFGGWHVALVSRKASEPAPGPRTALFRPSSNGALGPHLNAAAWVLSRLALRVG